MKGLYILLYLLSICHWAGAQQLYSYVLTDGWKADKAFQISEDTTVIIGLVSDPSNGAQHRIHFTTIDSQNTILSQDTFLSSDAAFVSYHSPFGMTYNKDKLQLNGLKGDSTGSFDGVSISFNKDMIYESDVDASYGNSSSVYAADSVGNRSYYFGSYQDGTRGNTVMTYVQVKSKDSVFTRTFHNNGLLSEFGECIMLPRQMLKTSDESFLLINEFKPVALSYRGVHQGLVIKIDSFGNEIWRLPIWEDSTSVHDLVVAPLANGNYMAVYQDRWFQPYMSPNNTRNVDANANSVTWFVEFSNDGQIIKKWNLRKQLADKLGVRRYLNSYSDMLVQKDGAIILVGSARGNGVYGYDLGFVLKLDKNGKYKWYRQYDITIAKPYAEGKENIFTYGVTKLVNGGYALAGEYRSDPSARFPNGTQRGLVLFVDSFGCYEPGCESNDKIGMDIVQEKHQYFAVYPNPSTGTIHLEGYDNLKPVKIEVFDMQGREISFTKSDPFTFKLLHLHKSAGVYYLKIYRSDGFYETHKIIKQ